MYIRRRRGEGGWRMMNPSHTHLYSSVAYWHYWGWCSAEVAIKEAGKRKQYAGIKGMINKGSSIRFSLSK